MRAGEVKGGAGMVMRRDAEAVLKEQLRAAVRRGVPPAEPAGRAGAAFCDGGFGFLKTPAFFRASHWQCQRLSQGAGKFLWAGM